MKKGISIIVLVITIVVILIMTSMIVLAMMSGGITDNAKKAKFFNDFKIVEEAINMYSVSKITNFTNITLPVESKLTFDEKNAISENVPTLKTKIEELNPGKTINDINLYWINESEAGVNNISKEKQDKGYIIDASTMQIYDYVGDYFSGMRWHTLAGGILESEGNKTSGEVLEVWDGWIRLTLYYPRNATNKEWRLGSEGEIRVDPMLMWQNYTGVISIPISRTKDVWIRYDLNDKKITIPPAGTLLVDIVPDSTGNDRVTKVNVKINYDEGATIKEYRVGNSGWLTYNSDFVVTENCIIEARAKKTENVYDSSGNLLIIRDIAGSDIVYVGNVGVVETNDSNDNTSEEDPEIGENKLLAPIIKRLPAQNPDEKARVQITYPSIADKKIYKINNGIEEQYTEEIIIQEWGTNVLAYYYDVEGNTSKASSIVINEVPTQPNLNVPITNNPGDTSLVAPTITRLPAVGTEKARVKITYPANADKKIYIENYGIEQEYIQELLIENWGTNIVAYYYDINGTKSKASEINIDEIETLAEPFNPTQLTQPTDSEPPVKIELVAPTITRLPGQNENEKARVNIVYPEFADRKIYTIDNGEEKLYDSDIVITEWKKTIIAYYYDEEGNKSKASTIQINDTTTGEIQETPKPYVEPKTDKQQILQPAPVIVRLDAQNVDEKARVQIFYPTNADRKIYKLNYGEEQGYTQEIIIKEWGTNVVAYYYDVNGNMSEVKEITINEIPTPTNDFNPVPPYIPEAPKPSDPNVDTSLLPPVITRLEPQNDNEVANVNISYPVGAVRKIYTLNNGTEIEYTNGISIYGYGTKIMAFYYDKNDNRSRVSEITIEELSMPPEENEQMSKKPESIIARPIINISPSIELAEQVTVTVNVPVGVSNIYIKIGETGEYKEYIGPEQVSENTEIYAYYRDVEGVKSVEARKKITNIKDKNKPYLYIDASPYPWPDSHSASEVTITLKYNNADKIEYSEDGIIYKAYTEAFKVTKNKRIYAMATNTYGVEEAYIDITNIGGLEAPKPIKILNIAINADPDPVLSTNKVLQVNVSIEYDSLAKDKLYSIGKQGEIKNYTGPFIVTSNCTIYAYAKGEDSRGEASKLIDNVSTGIAEPIIVISPILSQIASKVDVTIEYDKCSNVKKYSINGGELKDYTEVLEVMENGTEIYAYSENELGQKTESRYTIKNIVPEPPLLLLDKGSYYLIKLSYPDESKTREYKWKLDGIWRNYNEDGILLIKPQFKDQVIKDGTLVKIEDENGDKINFDGDYFLIDVPISKITESIFMRWDRTIAPAPQIILNTLEPAKSVTATIIYSDDLIKKQYRILEINGSLGEWLDYNGPIDINKNGVIIYAKRN